MNKLFTLIILGAIPFFSRAQITIDSTDYPKADSLYVTGIDTMHNFDLGSASPNEQQWSVYKAYASYLESTTYVSAANAPGFADFPQADMAIFIPDGNMYVFLDTDSGLYGIGGYIDGSAFGMASTTANANPPEVFLLDSVNYGDSFGSNTEYRFRFDQDTTDQADTILTLTIDKDINADAWGEIATPIDTFDVLRLEEHSILSGVIEFTYFGVPVFSIEVIRENVYNYQFWADSIGQPVATITLDSNKNELLRTQFLFPDTFNTVSADFSYTQPGRDSVAFSNNSQEATSYKWFFGDGTTSTEPAPTHVYPDSGQYIVTLRATNAGSIDYHKDTIMVEPSGITAIEQGINFQIYPNPAISEEINIALSGADNQAIYFELRSITGALLIKQQLKSQNKIAVKGFAKGLYIYNLTNSTGEQLYSGKLILNQ